MNIKVFVDVWREEARILKNYLDTELKKAAEEKKTFFLINFDNYSAYAALDCMIWLCEEGYSLIETNIKNVYDIRW